MDDEPSDGASEYNASDEFEDLKKEWAAHMDGYPRTVQGQSEFVVLSLKLVRHEVTCMMSHADKGEWEELVFHLASDIDGLRMVFSAVLSYLMDAEDAARVMAELTRAKIEQQSGMPTDAIEVAPGMWALRQEPVVVPDDLSGMEG